MGSIPLCVFHMDNKECRMLNAVLSTLMKDYGVLVWREMFDLEHGMTSPGCREVTPGQL